MDETLSHNAWVGANYRCALAENRALFILDEAFYDRDGSLPKENPTAALVRSLALERRYAYFTKLKNLLSPPEVSRESFWHDVVFSHYIQKPVGDRARIRPSTVDVGAAALQFKPHLLSATPNKLLVAGKQLWHWLLDVKIVRQVEVGSMRGVAEAENFSCEAVGISHPSSFGSIRDQVSQVVPNSRGSACCMLHEGRLPAPRLVFFPTTSNQG